MPPSVSRWELERWETPSVFVPCSSAERNFKTNVHSGGFKKQRPQRVGSRDSHRWCSGGTSQAQPMKPRPQMQSEVTEVCTEIYCRKTTVWGKKCSALPLHLQNTAERVNAPEGHLPKVQFVVLKVKCISLVKQLKWQLHVLRKRPRKNPTCVPAFEAGCLSLTGSDFSRKG